MQTAVFPTRIRHGVYHVPGLGLMQGTQREAIQLAEARARFSQAVQAHKACQRDESAQQQAIEAYSVVQAAKANLADMLARHEEIKADLAELSHRLYAIRSQITA